MINLNEIHLINFRDKEIEMKATDASSIEPQVLMLFECRNSLHSSGPQWFHTINSPRAEVGIQCIWLESF